MNRLPLPRWAVSFADLILLLLGCFVMLHAMEASRPVVSTGPEGVWDMIEPGMGAIASPEHDVAATAAILAAYRDDPDRVAREGARGRALAEERYDGDKIAERIERLLTRERR